MTFENGPNGKARVDFSDPRVGETLRLKISIEMVISTDQANLWDNIVDDVQDLLKYAKK